MGIFTKIKEFIFGKPKLDAEWDIGGSGDESTKGDNMSYGEFADYDDGTGPTLLYGKNPQMCEIRGGGDPERLNDITMRETQRVNNSFRIPGQVVEPQRGRGRSPQMGARRIGGDGMNRYQRQQQIAAQKQLGDRQVWERQQWEYEQQQRQEWELEQQQRQQELEFQRQQLQRQQLQLQQQQMYLQQQQMQMNGGGYQPMNGGYQGDGMQQQQWGSQPVQGQPMGGQPGQQNVQQGAQQGAQVDQQGNPVPDPNEPANKYITRCQPNFCEPYTETIVVGGNYHFFIDLPGVEPDKIGTTYFNMNLVITGTRKLQAYKMFPKTKGRGKKGKNDSVEYDAMVTVPPQAEQFSYTFEFPRPIDKDNIRSGYENGVYHVIMPIVGVGDKPAGVVVKLTQPNNSAK